MSNNVLIAPATTGGIPVATDDVGGVQYQRIKLDAGADGVSAPVTTAAPLPVVQTGTPGLPTGAATEATLATLGTATLQGALTETAPSTDTASSGLNGRLQRIAQRLTTLIAIFSNPIAVSQPGLSGGIVTTWTAVLTTATLVPAVAQSGRAAFIVQAWEGNALPIFIGNGVSTARVYGAAPGAADGIMLEAKQSQPISLAEGTHLYARATGTGCYIGIFEVAAA